MLRESEISASHGGNITFSRCSENTVLSSVKSETIPFCLGTNTFCSESKTAPMTNSPRFGSKGAFSINVTSSTTEANPTKHLSVADSYRKGTPVTPNFVQTDNSNNNNGYLPPPACLSPYSSLTITLSTVSSQSSILSTKKPESVTKTTITSVNNSADCNDSNRRAQRNFDLLREKMISLMENDVRLLQQLLALGDSIQELKSKSQAHHCSQLSLNSLEEEIDDDEEWWSDNKTKTFNKSISAVTNLYVDDEPKENQNKQYFSRKNSVLRIPIPPRSCNRMSTNEKLHRRLSQLSQRCQQLHHQEQRQHQQELVKENSSQTDGNIISTRDLLPLIAVTCPSSCQTQSIPLHVPSATIKQTFDTTDTRISNGSIDSGIRDGSCSSSSAGSLSPFLKNEKC